MFERDTVMGHIKKGAGILQSPPGEGSFAGVGRERRHWHSFRFRRGVANDEFGGCGITPACAVGDATTNGSGIVEDNF